MPRIRLILHTLNQLDLLPLAPLVSSIQKLMLDPVLVSAATERFGGCMALDLLSPLTSA